MNLAPIALFIFNRPHYLLRTLESLEHNILANESLLIIYADGPKEQSTPEARFKIEQARQIARSKKWCKDVRIVERSHNFGLANSIIAGVTEVVNQFGTVIVLEDDLELSPFFLKYMNDALHTYKHEDRVVSIGACNFFANGDKIPETFFIPIPDCLGWATWRNRWELFEANGSVLLARLKSMKLINEFNLGGAYDFEGMLENQIAGNMSSWAIRWQAVSYIHNKLTLYPKYALANHIGVDEQATNSAGLDYSDSIHFPENAICVRPFTPGVNEIVMKEMTRYYLNHFGGGSSGRRPQGLTGLLKALLVRILRHMKGWSNAAR